MSARPHFESVSRRRANGLRDVASSVGGRNVAFDKIGSARGRLKASFRVFLAFSAVVGVMIAGFYAGSALMQQQSILIALSRGS